MTSEQADQKVTKWWLPLALLVLVFLVLGTCQTLIIPFFQGPDEQVHYATVQNWAESREMAQPAASRPEPTQSDDIQTYRFSEEVRETAHRMQFDEIKWQGTNTQRFATKSRDGENEGEIRSNAWHRSIDVYPTNASGTWSLYYLLGSGIELLSSTLPIFDRMFLVRFLSVVIGMLTVLLAYTTARKLSWSPGIATIFASLIAFQPMFIATSAVINIDILLIFSFSLFFYGAVRWFADGASLPSGGILLFATFLGIFAKGPGIVLLGLLLILFTVSFYQQFRTICRERLFTCFLGFFVVTILVFIFIPPDILANFLHLGTTSVFSTPLASLSAYIEKTLSAGPILWTAVSYWGSFGWLDNSFPRSFIHIILTIETVAVFGLLWFCFDKNPPRFLPKKRILILAVLSVTLLQLAIRFFDWRVFDATGEILIGTPGRYFLPNIIPHLLLVVSGLGYLLPTPCAFRRLLLIFSASLFSLVIYATWFVIVPRYYL